MNISFIIITDGKKPHKILNQIQSIRYQRIPNYEIIISGNPNNIFYNQPDITIVEDKKGASSGNLSSMRNKACKIAKYEYFVISDDDMLFSLDWYSKLSSYKNLSDITTTCVKLPDGTRFWDYCCYNSPVNGHQILNTDEHDDYLYMSGGQSWIMNRKVFDSVQWDENISFYQSLADKKSQNEDTDFAERCRNAGFIIKHIHNVLVYHDDATYSSVGRNMGRRKNPNIDWILLFKEDSGLMSAMYNYLVNNNLYPESIDMLRCVVDNYPSENQASVALSSIYNSYGGQLSNSNFTFNNHEYKNILKVIYET
jgi:hypothetical protein